MHNPSLLPYFLPYFLPYLGVSGWFSVGLGARNPLNTNDFGMWLLRGGGSETRKVDGSTPSLATTFPEPELLSFRRIESYSTGHVTDSPAPITHTRCYLTGSRPR